jgi:hypothetical protein
MSTNKFTTNNNSTLAAVSNVDGETPVYLYADPVTHALTTSGSGGSSGALNIATTNGSALNADIMPSTDVSAYKSFSVQITGVFSATYTFQGSNDNFATANSTFPIQVIQFNGNNPGLVTSSGTSNIIWKGPINFRYMRVRLTSYTSGTATADTTIFSAVYDPAYIFANVNGTVTATPPSATATGSITASAQTVNLGTNLIGGGGFAAIQVFGTYAGVSFTLQASGNNGTNLYNTAIFDTNANRWLAPGSTISPGTNIINTYYVPVAPYANQTRLVSTAFTSGTMSIVYTASVNGTPGSIMTQGNEVGLVASAVPTSASFTGQRNSAGNLAALQTATGVGDGAGDSNLMTGTSMYNNSNWDRLRNNTTAVVIAAGATTTQTSATQISYNANKLAIAINISAFTSGTLTFTVNGITSSGYTYPLLVSTALAATGLTVLRIFPGSTPSANAVANDVIPRSYNVVVTGAFVATYGVDSVLGV